MIRRIIDSSIKFRALVVVLAGALLIFGTTQVAKAPVDVLPEFTAPVVEIQTESLGLSADEVEQLLTVPMEQDLLNGVKGAQTIRSNTVPGLSSIDLTFARGTDILRARQLIQERLTQAFALPGVGKPPQMLQPVSSTSHVMIVGLSSKTLSPIELSVLARWTVRPRLMGLAGVANVAIWGMRDRQFQVLVDPARLHAHGVTLAQVIATSGNAQLVSRLSFLEASTPGTGGFIDGPSQRLSARHVLPFGAPRDLAQVPVEGTHGKRAVPLGSVSVLREGHQPLIGDAVVRGAPGLVLVVDKLPGANTLAVTHELDQALADLRQGLAGVAIDSSIYRPATFIENALHHLVVALLVAGALAVFALLALVRRWRAVFVSVVTIPLSLLAALLVLDLEGSTINLLAIAGLGIALGVVVDDAVGASQTIAQLLRERSGRAEESSTVAIVLESSLQLRSALGYATLIILLTVAPILIAHGLTASFVHPMALAFVLAVLASMLVALTVAPALSVLLASLPSRPERRSRLRERLVTLHGHVMAHAVRTRLAVPASCVLGLCALVAAPLLMQAHAPSFKDRDLLVSLAAPPGTSLTEMERVTTRVTGLLRSLPAVADAGADVGRAVSGDQIVGTNSAEVWLSMRPSADYTGTIASVHRIVEEIPGVNSSVMTYGTARSAGVFASPDGGLTVRVYGDDYGVLGRQAQLVRQVLSGIGGVKNPRVVMPVQQPSIRIEVNLAAALSNQLKPGEVRRAAGTLMSGLTVGDFFEQQKVFEVVVRGVDATQHSLSSVRNLLIDTPDGDQVRLGSVAQVSIAPEPVDIRHDAVSRYVDVSAVVHGRDIGSVRAEAQRDVRRLTLPLEYHAEVLGRPADSPTSSAAFLSYVLASAIGIFLLLQAAFGSWRLAALVMLMLPVSLIGGIAIAVATGNEHALGAVAGLVAVFAIAVRQAVVLLRSCRRFGDEPGSVASEVVREAVRERLQPTVTSMVTTAVAVLPFALLGDVAGNEITHPMSLVILGGLVTTLLILIAIPAAYVRADTPWRSEPSTPPTGGREEEIAWSRPITSS